MTVRRYRVEAKPQFYIEGGGGPWDVVGHRSTKRAAVALAERTWRSPSHHARRLYVVDTETRYIVWSMG